MTSARTHIPTLETERFCLRAPEWRDFDDYAAFRASDRVKITGGPFTREQAFGQLCAILGHWDLRGYGRWMVADKKTDTPLGIVGLFYPIGWPAPELAWSVFDAAEGRSVAYEAALASRAYAYDTLGWTSLISMVSEDNVRSTKLAERLGCTSGDMLNDTEFGNLRYWHHPAPEALA